MYTCVTEHLVKSQALWVIQVLRSGTRVHSLVSSYTRFICVSLSLIRFRWSVSGRCCLDGSADLLLFVPLSRHLPQCSHPHPSLNVYLAFLRFFGLSLFLPVLISPVFCVFICPKYLMNWFGLCSVGDTRNSYSIYFQMHLTICCFFLSKHFRHVQPKL